MIDKNKIQLKVKNVILMCETYEQLRVATRYANLAYAAIAQDLVGNERNQFQKEVNMSCGYVLGSISMLDKLNKECEK